MSKTVTPYEAAIFSRKITMRIASVRADIENFERLRLERKRLLEELYKEQEAYLDNLPGNTKLEVMENSQCKHI